MVAHDKLYALLKQKLEAKTDHSNQLKSMSRHLAVIMLAVGCGIVGGTLLDVYVNKSTFLGKKRWCGWLIDLFGSAVENASPVGVTVGSGSGVGVNVEGGIRLRTPEELKNLVTGTADKVINMTKEKPPEAPRKTLFKPLFCLTTVSSYFICRYLLREQYMPYYDALVAFVADWEMNKIRTPKEFHPFFDQVSTAYQEHDELMISEDVAMTMIRQIMTVCTSRINDELGVSDTEVSETHRALELAEKESTWIGWQLLPTICKLFAYFFVE